MELVQEVFPTVDTPHQIAIMSCFRKSIPHVAQHYCSDKDTDYDLYQVFRFAAEDAAPELHYEGLEALEAYIQHSWSNAASFAEEAFPFLFDFIRQETVDNNLAMACKLIGAYCGSKTKAFRRAVKPSLGPILREMIPYFHAAKTTEAQCIVLEILANCTQSSSPVID
jgi:hypothetical protein